MISLLTMNRITILALVVSAIIYVASGFSYWALVIMTIVQGVFTILYVVRNAALLLGPNPFSAFMGTVWRFLTFVAFAVTFGVVLAVLYVLIFVMLGIGETLILSLVAAIPDLTIIYGIGIGIIVVMFSLAPPLLYLLVTPFILVWRRWRMNQGKV